MIFRIGLRHFLLLFLPPAVLIVLGIILYGQAEIRRDLGQAKSLQLIAVAGGADEVRHSLRSLSADVTYLASLPRLSRTIVDPSPENMQLLSANFMAFANANEVYDQIRWLDETGQERVRVNYVNKRAVLVPPDELQNKSDRYYFKESNWLDNGMIYLSPFDLNIEHKEIEKPYKPTLRMSTPLFDSGGNRHGILVLNYLGQNLLDTFSRVTNRMTDSLMLVNRNGYWLSHPDKTKEWGFMFGRDGDTLASRNPNIWQKISSTPEGQIELSDGLWTWQTINPSREIALGVYGMEKRPDLVKGTEMWKAVSHLPEARLMAMRAHIWSLLIPVAAFLICLAGLGSVLLAHSHRRIALLNDGLVRRIAEADAANRAKASFLANMSHEIRTPMNAILGLAHLLASARLRPDELDLVNKIRISGQLLLATINNILDLSKIEAGRLELEKISFPLSEVLDQLAVTQSTGVRSEDLELIIGPPPREAETLIGDPLRLQQVLANLTSNAIKFTPSGSVMVRVSAEDGDDPSKRMLRFSVKDTGIGIAAEQQVDIFAPFSQADSSTTRKFGGTGLGLTISHHLVATMGGEIGVNSQPGQGSEFWFTIPLVSAGMEGADIPGEPLRHLLVVDDNPLVREMLLETGQALNWTAEAATSGKEALARIEMADGKPEPLDVILIDWAMPGMNGVETARAIRRIVSPGQGPLLLIMVTPFARSEVTDCLAAEAGTIDGIISKPVTVTTLRDSVERALRFRQGLHHPSSEEERNDAPRLAGLRVLVVDDSEINREVACRLLEVEGAIASLAEDGRAATVWLSEHPKEVDVVLMDIQMPLMDGYEACRRIRAEIGLTDLPVIALTAGTFRSERDEAMAAGMNGFIAKPIDVEQLVSTLEGLPRRSVPPMPPKTAPAPSDASGPGDRTDSAPTEASGAPIAYQMGLNIWRDEKVYRKYLHHFLVHHGASGHKIAELLAEGDKTAASQLIHKLKGVAGNLALPAVAGAASKLELAISGKDADSSRDIEQLTAALRKSLDSVCRAISALAEPSPSTAGAVFEHPQGPSAKTNETTMNLLRALTETLAENNPDPAEPILAALADRIPAERIAALTEKIEEFDFRGAEGLVAALESRIDYPARKD